MSLSPRYWMSISCCTFKVCKQFIIWSWVSNEFLTLFYTGYIKQAHTKNRKKSGYCWQHTRCLLQASHGLLQKRAHILFETRNFYLTPSRNIVVHLMRNCRRMSNNTCFPLSYDRFKSDTIRVVAWHIAVSRWFRSMLLLYNQSCGPVSTWMGDHLEGG